MYFLQKAGIHFERGHLKGNPLFSEIEKENLNTKGKQLHRERVQPISTITILRLPN